MQSSLGIFVENNIIKYVKLQKDKDFVKIDAYNTVFYEGNLQDTIDKIISETYSYNVPISININDEIYDSFQISSLISKKDAKKSIAIEYDILCDEKGYNKSSIECRYLTTEENANPEYKRVLSITENKNSLKKQLSNFEGYKITTATPISTSIVNLLDFEKRENIAIVNIEEKTRITTLINGKIYQVDVLEEGMGNILNIINRTENSMSKAYEVCKNMTIYTQDSSELYSDGAEYREIVTNELYKIIDQTKKIVNGFFSSIDKIYITGSGTCINNIDLFFQDYITASKCEILKPFFMENVSIQFPIKECIENSSACALALDGLGMLNKDLNFLKGKKQSKISSIGQKEINLSTIKEGLINFGTAIKTDFSAQFGSIEKLLSRGIISCIFLICVFSVFSIIISHQIKNKKEEVETAISQTDVELGKLKTDIQIISERSESYNKLIKEITLDTDENEESISTDVRVISKDSIPNLLNRIMFVIPKNVKLNSIKNTKSNHIEIKAEAEKYEQLGYFKAVLTTNGILQNVKSTSGEKTGSTVQVTIEGDLP